jgi:hypothetical protein
MMGIAEEAVREKNSCQWPHPLAAAYQTFRQPRILSTTFYGKIYCLNFREYEQTKSPVTKSQTVMCKFYGIDIQAFEVLTRGKSQPLASEIARGKWGKAD